MQVGSTVCNQCKGVIPTGASYIGNWSGSLIISGAASPFSGLDFCCTDHLVSWAQAQLSVPAPQTPFQPIPTS